MVSIEDGKCKTKYRLTINEKILLHLLDNYRSKDRREAPFTITQKGIAEGVNIRWNHVPRAMAQLMKMEYVFERTSHIAGKTRRQKTYYLTDGGMLHAKNLREKILGWEVYLKRLDGQITKMRLSKVNPELKTKFPPLTLYKSLSEEGIIEEKELISGVEEEVPQKESKTFFAKGEISWPKKFINRRSELETLQNWMDDNKHKTIVIYGSVGIGKTALMIEFLKANKDKKHIFWYEMSENDTQLDIFTQLSEFLSSLRKTNLKTHLDEHDTLNLEETLRILEKDLRDADAILAFDNYFKVSEDVADLFSGFSKIAAKNESWKIIINALDTTPFYCRFYDKSEIQGKKIAELTIKGMDMEGCKELLEAPNIEEDALKKIHLMTRGNPLTIELIKRGDVNSLKRIKGFSRQEASLLLYLKGVEGK
ncbi:MAG: hypothetical protein JSV09_00780 [Thermoplasmata archaeon]|nr:MAG: hypothetical protein JSV09_00780 [Thermoplasmata archaeon]